MIVQSKAASITLSDHGDRAQTFKTSAPCRLPLELIGFWPGNRGKAGVEGHHLHEVTNDIVVQGTKRERYVHVSVVKIPQEHLPAVREINRLVCKRRKLLPPHSPAIEYLCLTKTHFTFGQKLVKQGGRYLYDRVKSGVEIKLKLNDTEGKTIQELGPICVIYAEALYNDYLAMSSFASEDNLNQMTQLAETEMNAFNRVSDIFGFLSDAEKKIKASETEVLTNVESSGLGCFTSEEWTGFIKLRSAMPTSIATMFTDTQFQATASQVRVRPEDFLTASKMDFRCPLIMVAVLLHQFIDTFTFKKLPPISATCYKGREDTFARLLDVEAFSLLACEAQFNKQLHDFTIAVITHYAAPPNRHEYETSQNIQASRGEFLSVIGKQYKTTAAEMKKNKG